MAKAKKTRPSPARRITKKALVAAIKGSRGNISEVARRLGFARNTVYTSIERMNLWGSVEDEREMLLDDAELAVQEIMLQGEEEKNRLKAAMFTLERRGKHRGWAPKQETEISGPGGGPVQVESLPAPSDKVDLSKYAEAAREYEGQG